MVNIGFIFLLAKNNNNVIFVYVGMGDVNKANTAKVTLGYLEQEVSPLQILASLMKCSSL